MANNDWLDIDLLEDYLDGKLDSKAMHQIEKQALEDPFVAQALAGLSESPKRALNSVSILQKQLYDRIAAQEVVKKESVYTWQRLSVGAAAAVMFITVSIIFFMREEEHREQLTKTRNQPKTVEVNLAPSSAAVDSAKVDLYASNKKMKSVTPIGAAKINPKREAHPGPATSVYVSSESLNTAVERASSDSTNHKNAGALMSRVATVLPMVSAPIGGWANLDSYLADHNKLSKDNKLGQFVELSFLIDTDGKPSDIKVIKGASPEIDEEAVRLISEGPKWEQPKTAGSRVSYTLSF